MKWEYFVEAYDPNQQDWIHVSGPFESRRQAEIALYNSREENKEYRILEVGNN